MRKFQSMLLWDRLCRDVMVVNIYFDGVLRAMKTKLECDGVKMKLNGKE